VQKFTRPLTREVEVGGERLALTLSDKGISVRPVGARKPPHEITWAALVAFVTRKRTAPGEPTTPELAAAVGALKAGAAPAPPAPPQAANPAPPSPAPVAASPITALLGRLERWLAQHRERYLRGLAPGASAARLEQLQTALGRPLPEDLRALLAWRNGQDDADAGRFVEGWFLMSADEIEAARKELTSSPEAERTWRPEWIPFLEDDRGNYVFLDTSQPGVPVREFWEKNREQPTVAPSLAAWLEEFVTAVEAGKFTQDPERGWFVRQTSVTG
jgi:cell wall assembly regulator SMI1